MVRPQVSVQSGAVRGESLVAARSRRIALPRGSWSLIGKFPNEVCYSHGEFFQGTIGSCPFDPSWSVQVGSGPGAVVAVAAHPSLPRMLSLCGLTPADSEADRAVDQHRLRGTHPSPALRWAERSYPR